ncbi:MAG: hypothetical protein GY927_10625 [bacterium]|nr:hypothetical protein [bacterium]
MINLKPYFKDRPFFGRPLDLKSLITILATLFILTLMLGAMVWGRVSLLQNGTQVVLKTAPVDPRDLLRGYFVRLSYDISRLELKKLAGYRQDRQIPLKRDGYKKHANVYVELRPMSSGFWSPYWVYRFLPQDRKERVFIRGRVRSYSCRSRMRSKDRCTLSLRYGIEKFFADKTRAKKLEDFGRQQSTEITELRKQIRELEKSYRQQRQKQKKAERQDIKDLSAQLVPMRTKLSKLIAQNRLNMANRFAVIARIDKQSGEAAISGLQLDDKAIYEERLF